MIIWNGHQIRERQHYILLNLYSLRGATNEQLRRIFYGHLDSQRSTQLSNISRFISDLKKKKIVKSVSCHPYSPGHLNYLTQKGIDYVHDNAYIDNDYADIELGFHPTGVLGSFEYKILKPPTQYIEHHLMFVDTVIDYADFGYFRNNLYVSREYVYLHEEIGRCYDKRAKVRPDGELKLENAKGRALAAIEIDTGTERYKQLVEKFKNYRRYFDYCTENNKKIPWKGIVFHTKRGNESIRIEEDQRWQTILRAAVEGLSYYCWSVSLLGFNRKNLASILEEEPQRLVDMGIEIPPKDNPILLKRKQEERVRREEEEKRRKEEELRKEERRQQLEAENKRRQEVEKVNKENRLRPFSIVQEEVSQPKKKQRLFGKIFG